jgi:hypothetical protein
MGRSVRSNAHGHGGSYNRAQFLCFLDAREIFSSRKKKTEKEMRKGCTIMMNLSWSAAEVGTKTEQRSLRNNNDVYVRLHFPFALSSSIWF